ncbi:unnamed protein product [Rotaria sordida]|uniref:Uncharacterized protein n=2 Tax=Rotaria sordida TaxID=392033 RepID=A0A815NMT3_9BILA|nr:unnamed protein product [Rotaria sordida]CAF1440087.1 unnamed protein product [Rotaria sordida]CAF4146205.1 unnamed protein product [Rotaria sordida]CAF4242631.1 unnamed protein product [Rotaria sordida]
MREQQENNHKKQTFNLIEDICFKRIFNALSNWSTADVRTVPNVMYQLRCGSDENDETIEYQINWFIDCAETYIHNHRNSFYTYCLEGEYEEKIWKIIDDNDGTVTYQFTRSAADSISMGKPIPGTLRHVDSRYHFPGNKMHVDTESFHSVTPIIDSDRRVLTFLIKKKYSTPIDTFVLSSEPYFNGLNDEIRPATNDERHEIHEKLVQVLRKSQLISNHNMNFLHERIAG